MIDLHIKFRLIFAAKRESLAAGWDNAVFLQEPAVFRRTACVRPDGGSDVNIEAHPQPRVIATRLRNIPFR
jgi:hypothetical protein